MNSAYIISMTSLPSLPRREKGKTYIFFTLSRYCIRIWNLVDDGQCWLSSYLWQYSFAIFKNKFPSSFYSVVHGSSHKLQMWILSFSDVRELRDYFKPLFAF